jgi:hypothetical protein
MSSVTVIVGRVAARDERFAFNFYFSGLVVSLNQRLYLAACSFQPPLRAIGNTFEARVPRRHRSSQPRKFLRLCFSASHGKQNPEPCLLIQLPSVEWS